VRERENIVLIVEDHQPMRAALRKFLQAHYPSATILEAADGASAMQLYNQLQPRLVLTDIGLPDISGIRLVEQIRKAHPDARIIVVSQHTDSAYVRHAHAAGALHYVAKDRIAVDLLPAVAAIIDQEDAP
jgi:two-component system response regulator DegU